MPCVAGACGGGGGSGNRGAGDPLVKLCAAIETAAPTHAVKQARRRAHRLLPHVARLQAALLVNQRDKT